MYPLTPALAQAGAARGTTAGGEPIFLFQVSTLRGSLHEPPRPQHSTFTAVQFVRLANSPKLAQTVPRLCGSFRNALKPQHSCF